MKLSAIVCAIAAASLGLSSLAQAQGQGHDRRDGGDDRRMEQRDNRHDKPRFENGHDNRRADRNDGPRFDQRDERWNERRDYYNARGPEFSRGHYIPREYRSRQYVVTDYHVHHLPPPPRNHEWVQVGADYVLIAIATGVIAQIILSH